MFDELLYIIRAASENKDKAGLNHTRASNKTINRHTLARARGERGCQIQTDGTATDS